MIKGSVLRSKNIPGLNVLSITHDADQVVFKDITKLDYNDKIWIDAWKLESGVTDSNTDSLIRLLNNWVKEQPVDDDEFDVLLFEDEE